MNKRRHVAWKPAEKQKIVEAAVDIDRRLGPMTPVQLIQHAVATLPPDRRRNILQVRHVPWFPEAFERAKTKVVTQQPQPEPAKATPAASVQHLAARLADIFQAAADELRAFSAQQEEKPLLTMQPEVKLDAKPTLKVDGKPRIAVVGLTPTQKQFLQQRLGQQARVFFLDTRHIRGTMPNATHYILSRHIGHEWVEKAKSLVGHDGVVSLPTTSTDSVLTAIDRIARLYV